MTSKELLYIEDALTHEEFLKNSACNASENLEDDKLANYMNELESKHEEIYDKIFKLLNN